MNFSSHFSLLFSLQSGASDADTIGDVVGDAECQLMAAASSLSKPVGALDVGSGEDNQQLFPRDSQLFPEALVFSRFQLNVE